MIRIGRGALLCCLLAAACGHVSGYSAKLQPDGSYRIDCTNHLTRCLNAIEEVCAQGYEIVQAHEDVRYAGPREFNEASISSVVVARCRTQEPVFGRKGQAASPAPAPSAAPASGGADAAAPAPARGCFPGSTQACIGAGACKGGQQCLPDGAAFGPCDCGGPPSAAPEVTPAAPQ